MFILAHLVPRGTPGLLQPFIVLIELVRNVIRPLTLRVRLIANMIAGHLLLTLLGSLGTTSYGFMFIIIGIVLILMLELSVALIQAYVFIILASLYLREVNTVSVNKLN